MQRVALFLFFALSFAACDDCKDCTGTLVTKIDGEFRSEEILEVQEFCEGDLDAIEGKRLVKEREQDGHQIEEITIYDCIDAN